MKSANPRLPGNTRQSRLLETLVSLGTQKSLRWTEHVRVQGLFRSRSACAHGGRRRPFRPKKKPRNMFIFANIANIANRQQARPYGSRGCFCPAAVNASSSSCQLEELPRYSNYSDLLDRYWLAGKAECSKPLLRPYRTWGNEWCAGLSYSFPDTLRFPFGAFFTLVLYFLTLMVICDTLNHNSKPQCLGVFGYYTDTCAAKELKNVGALHQWSKYKIEMNDLPGGHYIHAHKTAAALIVLACSALAGNQAWLA